MCLASDKEWDGSSLAAIDGTDIDLSSTRLCALGSEIILERMSAYFHMVTRQTETAATYSSLELHLNRPHAP